MFELLGRHQQYKRATASFLSWLAGIAPPKARRAREILLAAQRLAASDAAVPTSAIADLQRAISLRKQVYLMYGDKDARHAYFIELLEDVKNILLASSAAGESGAPPALKVDVEAVANRFERLVIEESPDGPTAQPFLIGTAVRIHSLKGKPELNGKMGYSSQFIAAKGRYRVKIGAEEMLLKPDNLSLLVAEEEEESFILGETAEIEAKFLLQDLQTALEAVETAWDDYKEGKCTLLAATALTNACIRHSERLASETEINHPELSSLERIVTVAHMADVIRWVAGEFELPFDKALEVVADIAHGDPKNTKISRVGRSTAERANARRQLHGIALGMAVTANEGTVNGIDVSRLANPELLNQARAHMAAQVPNVSQEQIDATIMMVGTVVFEQLQVDFFQDTPSDNFLAGGNGLLYTSAFLRQLSAVGIVRVPTTWAAPNPGFFGPAWNESAEQATNVHELFDYVGCALPAWLWFAHYELRTGPGKDEQVEIPSLYMDTLMPFWKLLQNAMNRNRLTVALAIAVQAALLSVIRVNGQKRCMRVQVTARAGFAKALKHIQAAIEPLAADTSKNTEAAKRNLKLMEWWLDEWNKRVTIAPPVRGDDVKQIASRQRDQAMLQTPWVVGQQLLVISCGYGLECGVSNLDNVGQLSLALHLYNAMRVVDVIESLPLLELLMDEVGTNKAILFAGRPTCNFMKHWYHRMGMASDTKTQRKLTCLETQDLSTAFQRAALADFSDLSIDERADPLQQVLDGIRTAFIDDKLISFDINVLGSQLAALPEIMIDAMHLQAAVEKAAAEQMVEHVERGGGKKRGQRSATRGEQSNRDLNRRHAVYEALVQNVLMPCEFAVTDKSQPFLQSANSKIGPIDRNDLPPLSGEERQKLDGAAQTLKDYVKGLSDSSHRLL